MKKKQLGEDLKNILEPIEGLYLQILMKQCATGNPYIYEGSKSIGIGEMGKYYTEIHSDNGTLQFDVDITEKKITGIIVLNAPNSSPSFRDFPQELYEYLNNHFEMTSEMKVRLNLDISKNEIVEI